MNATDVQTPGLDAKLDVFRAPLPGATTNPIAQWLDWILRGVGQVVFQSNWLSGIVILIAIGVNSIPYMVAALVGVVASTATALIFKVDRGLIDAGLLGFNGVLCAIGLTAYMAPNLTTGFWPDPLLWVYIILCAGLSTVVFSVAGSLLGSRAVPALTSPFVFATWLFIFAVPRFAGIEAGPLLGAALPEHIAATGAYTADVWYNGIFRGIGEIFFQDNPITGILIAVGIFLNTRIGGLMSVLGPAVAVAVAMLMGADAELIWLGLFGFNASLTAIALGGFFFVLNGKGFLYAMFGTVVTVFAWPAFAVFLSPMGMPTFTFPFVLVTWWFIIAKPGFAALAPVAPADATYPEDNLRRWKAANPA